MFTAGHGDHWKTVTQFVRDNESLWAEAVRAARVEGPPADAKGSGASAV
jgi:hypothetical protein